MFNLSDISKKAKIFLIISIFVLVSFFAVETCILLRLIKPNYLYGMFGYICMLLFIPSFTTAIKELLKDRSLVMRELTLKNTYLEQAAKIIRHDMHSGIKTYLPRGVKSLKRRLPPEKIKELKIEAPIKMLEEGLKHTQKVYEGVYEFTNLVKHNTKLNVEYKNILESLREFVSSTSYKSQVILDPSLDYKIKINEALFCTAIDNLIRNGLKYNDSATKFVKIYKRGAYIMVEDNGRGMSNNEFKHYSKEYIRNINQKESGSGLGLNITQAILREHKFSIRSEKLKRQYMDFVHDYKSIDKKVKDNPELYIFPRDEIKKKAKKDKYRGKIIKKIGGRNNKIYIIYEQQKNLKTEDNKGTRIKIKIKNNIL